MGKNPLLLDAKSVKQVSGIALKLLKEYNTPEIYHEDLVQEILIAVFKIGHTRYYMRFVVIDVLRKEFGRIQKGKKKCPRATIERNNRYKAEVHPVSIEPFPGSGASDELLIALTYHLPEGDEAFEDLIEKAEARYRSVLVLYYKWGFNLKEIAHVFGYSHVYACIYLKEALEAISKKVNSRGGSDGNRVGKDRKSKSRSQEPE